MGDILDFKRKCKHCEKLISVIDNVTGYCAECSLKIRLNTSCEMPGDRELIDWIHSKKHWDGH